MGFFDNYKDEGGLNYISAEEKSALIKNKVPLTVLRVWYGEGQYGPKYTAVVEYEGEERAVSFGAGKVESRDRMFDAMMEWFNQEGEEDPPKVVLEKVKQSIILKNADA
jgi:hypothetical protein